MKNSLLILLLLFFSVRLFSQECDNQRYYDEIFSVNVTSDIKFGENAQPTILNPNNIQELFLDVYQPEGDTLSTRPLIIWAFGGGFLFGNRRSQDIVDLSNAFAKRGYVCASIDYRLTTAGLVVGNEVSDLYEAALKGTHDMRASIRFFYKDASTVNNFRIDTTRIFIGGVSAGAISALQIAHFDELSEVPVEMDSVFNATGGFEGTSGNQGYSDDVAGVVSLCGAVLDTAWINPAVTIPIASMHGTADSIVPYGEGTYNFLNISLDVDGSSIIHTKLNQSGIINEFYTFQDAGHTPFVGGQPENIAYMDTTILFVRDFLYDLVCDDVATSVNENIDDKNLSFAVFPNPNTGNFFIRQDSHDNLNAAIFDHLGRNVFFQPEIFQGLNRLDLDLPQGIYTVQLYSDGGHKFQAKKIIFQ